MKTDHERITAALLATGRSLPWLTAGGRVLVHLWPAGWHVGDVSAFLTGLKDGERDAVLFKQFKAVTGDPLDVLRAAAKAEAGKGAA